MLPSAQPVTAFRHVDRNDPATIAASELVFTDAAGQKFSSTPVAHVNKRGGETFLELLEFVAECYPTGQGHIVCDNLFDHDNVLVYNWNRAARAPKAVYQWGRTFIAGVRVAF